MLGFIYRLHRSTKASQTHAGKASAAVIQEAYVQGISKRAVHELVKAMSMSGISKNQVSRLCKEIDDAQLTALGQFC